MFRGICTFALLGLYITSPAWAQKQSPKTDPPAPAASATAEKTGVKTQSATPAAVSHETKSQITTFSPGELKPTPEMWFYEQYMRQYMDPKMAVRAKAEFKADQRQRRLEAMRWFGYSNSRPRVSPDPFNGDYAPAWTSNNLSYPYRWNGAGPTWYIARPMPPAVYTY
jgi:hypothetical protein